MNHNDFNPVGDEFEADPYNVSFKTGLNTFKNNDSRYKIVL